MALQTGDCFGHYEILAHVAQGGIGDVYRARDLVSERIVALKIPMRSVILNPSLYEQFLRECEAMRLLQHPAIQRGIESGRCDSTPFLVTEWIEGESLRHLLKTIQPFPLERALRLTERIADGLDYCHHWRVVHRDLKPDNILIVDGDQPIIVDFGLALTPAYPGAGTTAGTPDYIAPEQIEDHPGDARTDLYALGIILYELLAGQPPFRGQDIEDLLHQHLYAAVPRLDHVRADVSAQLATVIATCMQRDPNRRYADIRIFQYDLTHLDQVEVRSLDRLTAKPPRPPFWKTQFGQVFLLLAAFVVGTALLTLLAVTFKR